MLLRVSEIRGRSSSRQVCCPVKFFACTVSCLLPYGTLPGFFEATPAHAPCSLLFGRTSSYPIGRDVSVGPSSGVAVHGMSRILEKTDKQDPGDKTSLLPELPCTGTLGVFGRRHKNNGQQKRRKKQKSPLTSFMTLQEPSYDALYVTTSKKSRRKTLTFANIPGCESPRFPPDYLAAPPTSTAAPRSYPPSPSTKLLLETQLSRRTPRSVTKRLRCYPHTCTKCACTAPPRS